MKNPIQTYEANTVGRDFVIGDLHGCFDIFLNLLDNLKFNPAVDRMFSVGDLVDRGPDSRACLELLRESWFHACLANHEQMMLEAFKGGYMGQYWFRNGGLWGLDVCQQYHDSQKSVEPKPMSADGQKFMELLDIVQELPFVMTVGLANGKKIHIIHAELPPHGVITDEMLADPEQVMTLSQVQSSDGDFFVWGRYKYYSFFMSDLSNKAKNARVVKNQYKGTLPNPNLSHVISGHTKVQRALTIIGQTNLDTAAHESYKNAHGSRNRSWAGLTCLELNTWKFYRATDTEFFETEAVVVNIGDAVDTTELKEQP